MSIFPTNSKQVWKWDGERNRRWWKTDCVKELCVIELCVKSCVCVRMKVLCVTRKGCVWQCCIWKSRVWKAVCVCVKEFCVKGYVWKSCVRVTVWVWKNCVCVWKVVCGRVVCGSLCVQVCCVCDSVVCGSLCVQVRERDVCEKVACERAVCWSLCERVVCVCTIWIDVNFLIIAGACGSGKGNVAGFLYLQMYLSKAS